MTHTIDETGEERDSGGGAKSAVQSAASTAQEKASQKASELTRQGSEKLKTQIDSRTGEACRQARSVADALRQSAEQTRSQGNSSAAGIVDMGAQRADQIAEYLERTNGETLMRDAQHFSRQRPWLMAGVGVAAGMAVGRMIKAASAARRQSEGGGNGYQTAGYETAGYATGDIEQGSSAMAAYGTGTPGYATAGTAGASSSGGTGGAATGATTDWRQGLAGDDEATRTASGLTSEQGIR